jgi:RNA polymerase-binding transcription factor
MKERRTTHLTDADHQRLRTKLSTKRDELIAAQSSSNASQRGLHDRETEQGDIAEDQIEQAAALRLGHFDAALLEDVELALRKLDAGTYGVSEQSGEPIPLERLDALPWARRTAPEEERSRKGG